MVCGIISNNMKFTVPYLFYSARFFFPCRLEIFQLQYHDYSDLSQNTLKDVTEICGFSDSVSTIHLIYNLGWNFQQMLI